MSISKNQVVTLHYRLREDNSSGELIETTYDGDPLKFIFGIGQMLPSFEDNLEEKSQGESFEFTLQAEDAYGLYDENAMAHIPLSDFEKDGQINAEEIALGKTVGLRDDQGNTYEGVIVETTEEMVKIDFNHPMAGVDLHFTGEIVNIRAATESELDHGHIHE